VFSYHPVDVINHGGWIHLRGAVEVPIRSHLSVLHTRVAAIMLGDTSWGVLDMKDGSIIGPVECHPSLAGTLDFDGQGCVTKLEGVYFSLVSLASVNTLTSTFKMSIAWSAPSS